MDFVVFIGPSSVMVVSVTEVPVVTFSVKISPVDEVRSSVVVISADDVVKIRFSVFSSVIPPVTF